MVFTTQPYKCSKTDSQPFTAQLFIHKRPLITVLTELEIPGHPAHHSLLRTITTQRETTVNSKTVRMPRPRMPETERRVDKPKI